MEALNHSTSCGRHIKVPHDRTILQQFHCGKPSHQHLFQEQYYLCGAEEHEKG